MELEKKRATLFVLLIFFCGTLTGAVATNLWVRAVSSRVVRADVPLDSQRRQQRSVEWFTQELRLSPEQASQLKEILDETRRVFREEEQRIEAIRQESRNRIREILNDEQRARYDEIRARRDRRKDRDQN